MTREEIEQQYQELARKAGDTYFIVETLIKQLDAAKMLQREYHQEREMLQKALQALVTAPIDIVCD